MVQLTPNTQCLFPLLLFLLIGFHYCSSFTIASSVDSSNSATAATTPTVASADTTTAAPHCPRHCTVDPKRLSMCRCTSQTGKRYKLRFSRNDTTAYFACPRRVEVDADDIRSLQLDLPNVTRVTLNCASAASFMDVLDALNARRSLVDTLVVEAYSSQVALTNASFQHSNQNHNHSHKDNTYALKTLELRNGGLIGLSNGPFTALPQLQTLVISRTKLQIVPNETFRGLSNLRSLQIYDNPSLRIVEAGSFLNLTQLNELLLYENYLQEISPNLLQPLTNLKHVNLGQHNKFAAIPESLFSSNPQLESVSLLNDDCASNCSRRFSRRLLANLKNLRQFNYSALDSVDAVFSADFFADCTEIEEIRIENARLPSDNLSLFRSLRNLKILDVRRTHLRRVALEHLPQGLEDLRLEGNPFDCDCTNVGALQKLLLLDKGRIEAEQKEEEANGHSHKNELLISCGKGKDDRTLAQASKLVCSDGFPSALLFVLVLVPLLGLMFILIVYLKYKSVPPPTGARYGGGRLRSGSFSHDAFISYVDEDEDFLEQLLDALETQRQLKCLIHKRDFDLGVAITENINQAVAKSRSTIIVLSRSFLESSWCRHELLLACSQDSAILVIMRSGEGRRVNDAEMQDQPEILSYIRTNTYLEEGDPLFEQKLAGFVGGLAEEDGAAVARSNANTNTLTSVARSLRTCWRRLLWKRHRRKEENGGIATCPNGQEAGTAAANTIEMIGNPGVVEV